MGPLLQIKTRPAISSLSHFTSPSSSPPAQIPMASRGASASASGLWNKKRIILRKVGLDSLPVQALDALKNTNDKMVMEKAERPILPSLNLQFTNKPNKSNKAKKTWRPNLSLKRLFNYIHDREIEPKIAIHSMKCIDRTGKVDSFQIKAPYQKPEKASPGLLWKGKVERGYLEFRNKAPAYFSPQEEAVIAKVLREIKPSQD